MSSSNEASKSQLEFESLLQRTKDEILSKPSQALQALSPTSFELLVFETLREVAVGGPFEGTLIHTKDREFPDVVTGAFGVEVKATKDDNWKSIGNSVLESSRVEGVEKIYVFFGKLGGEPDILYRDYEECLVGISVTHYPRYQINMRPEAEISFFEEIGVTYDELRNLENPVKPLRAHYKEKLKPGQALWWIDDDLDKTATTDPVIKSLSSLSADQQDDIKADIFVHFPEVFSSGNKKFERIPAYLASAHSVLTPHLRDFFTAGGQVNLNCDGEEVKVPQIIGEAYRLRDKIKDILVDQSEEDLIESWEKSLTTFTEPIEAWLDEVDRQAEDTDLPFAPSKLLRRLR